MELAEEIITKLSKLAQKSYASGKIEETLELIRAKARLEYTYNQFYKDDESENILAGVSKVLFGNYQHKKNDNTVLFYDGFGIDSRGLAPIYLKAIVANGYKLIYITCAPEHEEQPRIESALKGGNAVVYHLDTDNCVYKIKELEKILSSNEFSTAFLYTTPWDVVGVTVFNGLRDICRRYQINLTDHAFWLGINAFDYCIEFRNYGAAISKDYRGIDSNKLVRLPYYPLLDGQEQFQGFPFDDTGKKVIFSGGMIYKTIDSSKLFYKLISNVLEKNEDAIFVYASRESCEDLDNLISRFNGRAFHVQERQDLVEVLKNSYLYLNTYPISGALMLQYAAIAGCIPITLKRSWDDDATGILMNEDILDETFVDLNKAIDEIGHLLKDEQYYREKKRTLLNQVISEQDFTAELNTIIQEPDSSLMSNIQSVDTKKFRQTYDDAMTEKSVIDSVIQKENNCVYKYFPKFFLKSKINNHLK